MGEEGKVPPRLTKRRRKASFRRRWTPSFLRGSFTSAGCWPPACPYWGKEPLETVVDAFQKSDSSAARMPLPRVHGSAAQDGRTLMGTKGLGCVNCHGVLV